MILIKKNDIVKEMRKIICSFEYKLDNEILLIYRDKVKFMWSVAVCIFC